jgi:hypothetical protein
MKITPAALALLAVFAASSIGVHAQGGAAVAAAARLGPAPTGSMGALTKAAAAVRSSRAAALAGKGLASSAGSELGRTTQIMGYLWTSNNGAMTNASVQIRNTVTNAVEKVATTNAAGEFVFQNITPGEYVIEYVGDSAGKSILAIGHPFTVSPGETVATFVRVTNGLPMLLPNELSNLSSNVATQAVTSAATQGITSIATPLVSVVPPVVSTPNDPTPPSPPPVVSAIK